MIGQRFMQKLMRGEEFEPVQLGKVAKILRGTSITEKQTTPGDYPVVANGPSHNYYHNEFNRAGETVVIARSGAYAGLVSYWNVPIFLTDAFSIDPEKSKICVKYLYYALKKEQTNIHNMGKGAGVPHVRASDFEVYEIPIPCPENPKKSLEIQAEIVRILDTFSELTAELTARKKQYNYYRDQLLKFENTEVEWKPLGEVSENYDSLRKPVTSGQREAGEVPYYGASGVVDYVKDYIFDGDFLLVSEDGANLVARNTPIAFSISGKSWVNNHAHVLKFNTYAERRFVEFYLNSIDLTPYISGAAQPKLNQRNLNGIYVPNPPLAVKERIVAILDKFDTLTTSISEGLPREIELRQKQYEYYRDQLLSFPSSPSHSPSLHGGGA